MASQSNERTKYWAFVAYPESLPEHWESILNEQHVEWFCSPLHDADENPDGGEKKQHYHIILVFPSMKSESQVTEITKGLLNSTIPQIVRNMRAYLRYFCHLDNPEKHQYPISDIRCFGGAFLEDYLKLSSSEETDIYDKIIDCIEENDFTEYADLISYVRLNEPGWRSIIYKSSTIFFSAYLNSRRYKKSLAETRLADSVNEPSN